MSKENIKEASSSPNTANTTSDLNQQRQPSKSDSSMTNTPGASVDAPAQGAKQDSQFLPPPAVQHPSGTVTFVARIPFTDRKKFLLSQLFDSAGEPLRDYMPFDQTWGQKLIKGSWYSRPRLSIPLLPPRSIVAAAKLNDILGELDKFVRKRTTISLHVTPQKDLKSGKCIISLVCFSILANILVAEKGKPTLIQALSNYVAYLQTIQRQILEEIIELHPVTQAAKTLSGSAFDPRSLSILAVLTSLEREAKKRQAEEYAKLANQLFPPIDEIKDVLKRIKRFLFTVFAVAQHDEVPDDDLLNRLFDPHPTFLDQTRRDETAGLDEDNSQKLVAKMKKDGAAYRLLVEKRDEISVKLSQQRNVHVLEWAECQTYTRFIGTNSFIHKIMKACKAKSTEKPVYIVFMREIEPVTSLFLATAVLEQVVEKFDNAVNQLANLTAHVASAPIAACTEALAELKRKLDNFASTLNSRCSEAYGFAKQQVSLDLTGLSIASDLDQLTQQQAAQLLKYERLGEVVATPVYLLRILRLKDMCDQIRSEASKLVPHVNKLREAADVITALENILGIINKVNDFGTATSNAIGKDLPLDIEPLEVLKRKLAARAPIVSGLRSILNDVNNIHSALQEDREEKFSEESASPREREGSAGSAKNAPQTSQPGSTTSLNPQREGGYDAYYADPGTTAEMNQFPVDRVTENPVHSLPPSFNRSQSSVTSPVVSRAPSHSSIGASRAVTIDRRANSPNPPRRSNDGAVSPRDERRAIRQATARAVMDGYGTGTSPKQHQPPTSSSILVPAGDPTMPRGRVQATPWQYHEEDHYSDGSGDSDDSDSFGPTQTTRRQYHGHHRGESTIDNPPKDAANDRCGDKCKETCRVM